ncbi:cytochrome c maturation protein CcmE [Comamonas aquatica]|jgi:cytochrome c-type biogenesis protein CcmE|uniref:Cytochrome c-type biogenesis protein CcmE n=2 Tax=Comamonas aquatica TaxID=225991 RepID=A0A014P288_9BURK|nr:MULTISPECIES: cytochrome c maturation protein CcmE [Comamonas]ANY61433.1 cytochrome c biogenesis protein CcmE [Comamonas aquatica]EXU80255.1 cytochrome C biogenesis protein CcmE [Comamonas aquatica DA1877]MDH0380833.1 cytochrome c maturation protein CcmE [Comamonas aquatica]MDH0428508.1 cytochrome c maturation protein CcmE [Comamonas aquatica]MDH0494016.1 cytochrome c maturation protein CcmE [Comamonas aquatica]
MKPRRKRLLWVLAGVALVGLAVTLVLRALDANVMFFYSPSQIHAGEAPQGAAFRIGGLVEVGSLQRSADGLQVQFMVTDEVQRVPVRYQGLLPDLFREGKGVVASGKLQANGVFEASEVLAKHDENYMPPEAAKALEDAARTSRGQP